PATRGAWSVNSSPLSPVSPVMSRRRNGKHDARRAVNLLEDRLTPATAAELGVAAGAYAVGVLDWQTGDAVVYNADGTVQFQIATPYGADFSGGIRVALADVTGDGRADLVTAPGPGTEPLVRVYDGVTHQQIASFDAYESTFTGGVYVAAADLTADSKADILTGAD